MRTRTIAVAGLVALALAACSSGGDGDDAASTTTTAAAGTTAAKGTAGCDAPPVAVGEERVTTTSGGAPRWYLRHVPTGYDASEPTPVVLDLHGYSEGAQVHTLMSDLGSYGDTEGFITITPHGTGAVPRWDTTAGSADVTFIGDLLDEVEETLCVDDRRVFVTGLSNGAFLTSALACTYADRIAAAAPVAGIRSIDDCDASRPVPVIAFHGTNDTFVTYDGGYGTSVANLPNPDGSGRTIGESGEGTPPPADAPKGPTIEEITALWAERNGCTAKTTESKVATDVTRITWTCPKGGATELYRIEEGGHSWPGSTFSKQVESVVGRTTDSISANEVMWRFFQEHPLDGT